MKIENTDPPYKIRELCEEVFPLEGIKPIFTYGDTIYNPHAIPMTEDMFAHEYTHSVQQGDSPAAWWDNYFKDGQFRYKQELEAYRVQLNFVKAKNKDREKVFKLAHDLAKHLSGPMYGNLSTYSEALKAIRSPQ